MSYIGDWVYVQWRSKYRTSFWMCDLCPVFKWFGNGMVETKWLPFCQKHSKSGHSCPVLNICSKYRTKMHKNGTEPDYCILISKGLSFDNRTLKCPDFECLEFRLSLERGDLNPTIQNPDFLIVGFSFASPNHWKQDIFDQISNDF